MSKSSNFASLDIIYISSSSLVIVGHLSFDPYCLLFVWIISDLKLLYHRSLCVRSTLRSAFDRRWTRILLLSIYKLHLRSLSSTRRACFCCLDRLQIILDWFCFWIVHYCAHLPSSLLLPPPSSGLTPSPSFLARRHSSAAESIYISSLVI